MMLRVLLSPAWVLTAAFLLLIGLVTYIVIGKQGRELVFNRLNLHRRRAPANSTILLSSSVGGENSSVASSGAHLLKSDLPAYVNSFPPSRRAGKDVLQLISMDPDREHVNSTSPITENSSSNLTIPEQLNETVPCTPTGFSIKDIQTLGDFPPYDLLSGVPLPKPYFNFDLSKALPRPYRPFRWSYHQTMCTFIVSTVVEPG
jgi:hypothetical protein